MNGVILEIRAGAGGDEAELFAQQLWRMYSRYSQKKGWRINIVDQNRTPLGGIKSITGVIFGDGVGILKNESGVHRVQRIPTTEKSGRIHTSTVAVSVLPQKPQMEIEINPRDLKIETFRSSGPGGQHMQKTESAVRITHLPTGIISVCQDERSQFLNREKALNILKARLANLLKKQEETEISHLRREQIGEMERAEKIRTYNFPQDRITDHRLGKSWGKIENILDGNLEAIFKFYS